MTIDREAEEGLEGPHRAGDCALPLSEEACARLLAAHGPMVKAACHRILRDAALAEDAAQEVFLLLVRKLPILPPQTILGGWLYTTACHLSRTQQRALARRRQRENRPEAMEHLMNPAPDAVWRELAPMLDDAVLALPQRQRDLVLFRYFQNNSQRAAANLAGCSESIASRELASAVEAMRRFFSRKGVTVSGAGLIALLSSHGAQASFGTAAAASLSSASMLAGSSAAGFPILVSLFMKTTGTKIAAVAAALVLTSGTVHYFSRRGGETGEAAERGNSKAAVQQNQDEASLPASSGQRPGGAPIVAATATPALSKAAASAFDEAALTAARERQGKFFERMGQLALVNDPLKVQEALFNEYGIQLTEEEIRQLQRGGQKGFTLGLLQLWPSKQPQEALAWAASVFTGTIGTGVDMHHSMLEAARKILPELDRASLAGMLPEGPGKAKMLDLAEAATDPQGLARRVLSESDPDERASRLRLLAQGWGDSTASAEWARQNLAGEDKTTFYRQVGYNLAEQNPQAAIQMLSEMQGHDAYASTFGSMMRGLVQEGGLGKEAAELIERSGLSGPQRTDLISELARRWVRNSPDATVDWVNTLKAPEDFAAAIPLLVSQLDNDRVRRTMEAHLQNRDPIMERALIEAAAPGSLVFDPEKSRLILDPLISRDAGLQLRSGDGSGSSREELLWNSVNLTAKRKAEAGNPPAAMEWLATLPFANPAEHAKAAESVMAVWNVRSKTEASEWLENASLPPAVRTELAKRFQP